MHSLTLGVVVQGRKRALVEGHEYFYDPLSYFVIMRGLRFQAEILEGSAAKPFLSLVLQVEPAMVKRVLVRIDERAARHYLPPRSPERPAYVTPLDVEFLGALRRFIGAALGAESDRRVLAPIYLEELVYRVLQDEQRHRFVEAALREEEVNPVSVAIAATVPHTVTADATASGV